MTLKMRVTDSRSLRRRREELMHVFCDAAGGPLTTEELSDLAAAGRLSPEERGLYDELRRVELLLDS